MRRGYCEPRAAAALAERPHEGRAVLVYENSAPPLRTPRHPATRARRAPPRHAPRPFENRESSANGVSVYENSAPPFFRPFPLAAGSTRPTLRATPPRRGLTRGWVLVYENSAPPLRTPRHPTTRDDAHPLNTAATLRKTRVKRERRFCIRKLRPSFAGPLPSRRGRPGRRSARTLRGEASRGGGFSYTKTPPLLCHPLDIPQRAPDAHPSKSSVKHERRFCIRKLRPLPHLSLRGEVDPADPSRAPLPEERPERGGLILVYENSALPDARFSAGERGPSHHVARRTRASEHRYQRATDDRPERV